MLACGLSISGSTPTPTPTSTSTPTQTLTPTPTAGEWSGENGSFTLLESGEISNFTWLLNAKDSEQLRCPITLSENYPMQDGVVNLTLTNKNTGKISFSIKIVFTSATTATLSYEYDFCPSTGSTTFDKDGKTITFTGEATVQLTQP